MSTLTLGIDGFSYLDLREPAMLARLDTLFLERLRTHDAALADGLIAYREGDTERSTETSALLLACAPVLEAFIGELFGITDEIAQLRAETLAHDPVFAFKKEFVSRRARRRLLKNDVTEDFSSLDARLSAALNDAGHDSEDRELNIARYALFLLKDKESRAEAIELVTSWAIRAMTTDEGKAAVRGWASFDLPCPVDIDALVPAEPIEQDDAGRVGLPAAACRERTGFGLTDARMNQRQVLSEVDYCIYCHDHDGDFCSRGFPVKKGEPDQGIKHNLLGVRLDGCPLDEKISEMHLLKKDGRSLASLAMIMIDNPLCATTGHRICNDCMLACIYQKQQAVNIPEIETRSLTDVLALPWGVEIYDLLMRWHPLRSKQFHLKAYNGLKVLIAGMGPAGFTLAHHLTLEGFAVVGIDGLKIEPLPAELMDTPIRDYSTLEDKLDERIMAGFGGVAEYGITVRWDKNFLKLIYLALSRRKHFQVFGGTRFGGTITLEEAWAMGFDHLAIAVGAGLPQALPIPGSLAPGMRMAADFLMTLQLTGAAKTKGLANLQLRLPAVVIGGGLTGIDAATEAMAYYVVQVEKTLARYETLSETIGESAIRDGLDPASCTILDEHLEHARAIRDERARAAASGETPRIRELVQRWGGATVVYRRRMQDSPAYTRNFDEITKAMEEGVYYADRLSPVAAGLDEHGHINSLQCERMDYDADGKLINTGEQVRLEARSILVATGAKPNIAYFFEHRDTFTLDGANYASHLYEDGALKQVAASGQCKNPQSGPFTSYDHEGRHVSFIGDTHPDFNGNVVKAVASGLRSYAKITASFGARASEHGDVDEYERFADNTREALTAKVICVTRHTPNIVELVIKAPQAARRYAPSQAFRLQNFESHAAMIEGTRLQTETLPLTGSKVDAKAGTVSLIVRERGASSKLVSTFKVDEPVILMGPSGNRAIVPEASTILIIGDWLAISALRSLGPAYKAAGNRVLAVLSIDNADEVFCRDEIEAVCDAIVWVTATGDPVANVRDTDASATGAVDEILERYAAGELTHMAIELKQVDMLHIIADRELLKTVQKARNGALKPHLAKNPKASAAIYGSMQCMLKGVCSQCLQWQIDPATGERTKAVFACSWTDEPLDIVDLEALSDRLSQNRMQEHLTRLWLDHLLQTGAVDRA